MNLGGFELNLYSEPKGNLADQLKHDKPFVIGIASNLKFLSKT